MTDFTLLQIQDTYKAVLSVGDLLNGISASLQNVQDGTGENTPLQLSNAAVNIVSGFSIQGSKIVPAGSANGDILIFNGGTGAYEPTTTLDGGTF